MKQFLDSTRLITVSAVYIVSSISPVTAQQIPQINYQPINFPEKTTNYLAQASSIVTKVRETAETITVRIDFPGGNGSGIIIARQGNNYYILTAKHVVEKENKYQIVAPDGAVYPVDYTTVKKLEGTDLAVLQFQSQTAYQIATLVDYGEKESLINQSEYNTLERFSKQLTQEIQAGKRPWQDFRLYHSPFWLFIYGWKKEEGMPQPIFTAGRYSSSKLDKGNLINDEHSQYYAGDAYTQASPFNTSIVNSIFTFTNLDYEIVYTNPSFGGMSGSPVLDSRGKVIAIHTAAEGKRFGFSEVQLGYSTGVLIGTFLRLANTIGINPQWLNIEKPVSSITTIVENDSIAKHLINLTLPKSNGTGKDWLHYANHLWRTLKYEQAITAIERAIELEPDLAEAYYLKSRVLESTLNDFDLQYFFNVASNQNANEQAINEQAIAIQQEGEKLYHKNIQAIQLAIQNLKKATEIQPEFYQAWRELGDLLRILPSIKLQSKQTSGKIITENIFYDETLIELMSKPSAITSEDLKQLHFIVQDFKNLFATKKVGYMQALKAYNQAITINSQDSFLFSRQGDVLFFLDRCAEAIDSFSKAIAINPKGLYYRQRAIAYLALKELDKAIADYNRYRELSPTSYNEDVLKSLFQNKTSLIQWLNLSNSQKQKFIQLSEASEEILDFPRDCSSSNY